MASATPTAAARLTQCFILNTSDEDWFLLFRPIIAREIQDNAQTDLLMENVRICANFGVRAP